MSINEVYDNLEDNSSEKRHLKKNNCWLTRGGKGDKIVINTTKLIMERKKYQ